MATPFFMVLITLSATSLVAAQMDISFDILSLLPFTGNSVENADDISTPKQRLGFSHMIASLLAVDHFNSRNATIVPELGNISGCNYILNIAFADSQGSGTGALAEVLRRAYNRTLPDAFVGGANDATALQLSAAGTSLKIPTLSYGGLDDRVVTQELYPYSSRTSSDATEMGTVLLSYLFYQQRNNYIGFLCASSDSALQIQAAIVDQTEIMGILTQWENFQPPLSSMGVPPQDLIDALTRLRDTGFLTIVLIVDDYATQLPLIAEAAQALGMTSSKKYFWLVGGDIDLDFFAQNSSNEPLNQSVASLLEGSVTIQALDGFTANPASDKFLSTWHERYNFLINQSKSLSPVKAADAAFLAGDDGYLMEANPEAGSSFIFDAIMTLGLGLCESKTSQGADLLTVIEGLNFRGASGPVEFGSSQEIPAGRSGSTVTFGAFNLFPPNGGSYLVLTDILDGVPGTSKRSSWRPTATSEFPVGLLMLREPASQNYLTTISRVWGFLLFCVVILSAVFSVAWVYLHRKHRVVKASQPFFLYFVAFGAFLIAFGIVVNSFDEGRGWTVARLSAACTTSPWTVVLGVLVIYSALFCKLWRVNIVMQFRRKAVTVKSVIWPAVLLTSVALILMTVWTVVEGFRWVRTVIDPVTGASFGKCKGQHTVAYFTPIFLLLCFSAFLTAFMAYKTKDVDSAFSEGSWIFALIAVHIQFLLISIPLIHTLEQSSTNARYVGQATIFFAFSMSTLLLIIGPKIFSVHIKKGARDNVRVSIAGSVRVSGFQPSSSYVVASTAEVVPQPEPIMPRIEEGNEAEHQTSQSFQKTKTSSSSTSDQGDDEEADSLDDSVV